MKRRISLFIVLASIFGVSFSLSAKTSGRASVAAAQSPTFLLTQTPVRQLRESRGTTTISGTIKSIVGDEFVLDDGNGDIIVDADDRRVRGLNLQVGDNVTVTGEMDEGEFDAFSITRGDGSALQQATSSLMQTPVRQLRESRGTTIAGTVKSIVGNYFLLSDATGEVIVDAGPRWWQEINLNVGENVTVNGEMDEGEFDAFSITRGDGSTLQIRPAEGPPPWAGSSRRRS